MHAINYDYYRVFSYVVRFSNFTKAANALGSSQPNVTRAMNKLESQLGCRLFNRSHSGVTLTSEGEALWKWVQKAVDDLERGEHELSGVAALTQGTVTVGATETALELLVASRLSTFHERYPGIKLHLTNPSTPSAVMALARGELDLAFVSSPLGPSGDYLFRTSLTTFQDVLVASPAFARYQEHPLSLEEVAMLPLIMQVRGTMTYALYESLFLQCGVQMRPDMEVGTSAQIATLCKEGLGVAFLAKPMVERFLADGSLITLPLKKPLPAREILMLQDIRKPASHAVAALVGLMDEHDPICPLPKTLSMHTNPNIVKTLY